MSYRDKGAVPEVPILKMQPDLQHPHRNESSIEPLEPCSYPWRQQEFPQRFPFEVEGLGGKLTTHHICLPLFFCFSLGIGTFCTEVCTKQNSSSVEWKSSRLFPRCAVPFVQPADLGEGAWDIMPVPLGKHIQWFMCEKGNRLTRTRVSPNCFP